MAVTRYTVNDNGTLAWSTVAPAAGDLIIVLFANDGGDNQSTPTSPETFTRFDPGNVGTSVEFGAYYRYATGAETGNIVSTTIASAANGFNVNTEEYGAHVFKIPAAEHFGPSSPPELARSNATSGTANPPSLDPSGWGTEDTLWIVAVTRDDDDGFSSLGANYTTNFARTASGTNGPEIASSWRTNSAASEDPPASTHTGTAEEYIAFTIGVRPAPTTATVTGISVTEFPYDHATTLTISGLNFGAAQGTGTVYISDAATLAGSANEVDVGETIPTLGTWSDTSVQLSLQDTDPATIFALDSLGPGTRYVIVVNDDGEEDSIEVTTHRARPFQKSISDDVDGGDSTTAQLTPPSGKTTGDFGGGRIVDSFGSGTDVDLGEDEYREDEWVLGVKEYAENVEGETYQFRVVQSDGTPLDTYTVVPEITVAAAVANCPEPVGSILAIPTTDSTLSQSITVPVGATHALVSAIASNGVVYPTEVSIGGQAGDRVSGWAITVGSGSIWRVPIVGDGSQTLIINCAMDAQGAIYHVRFLSVPSGTLEVRDDFGDMQEDVSSLSTGVLTTEAGDYIFASGGGYDSSFDRSYTWTGADELSEQYANQLNESAAEAVGVAGATTVTITPDQEHDFLWLTAVAVYCSTASAIDFDQEQAVEVDQASDAAFSTERAMAAEEATEVDRASDAALTVEPVFGAEEAAEVDVAAEVVMSVERAFAAEEATEVDRATDAEMEVDQPEIEFDTEQAVEIDQAADAVMATERVFVAEAAPEADRAEEVTLTLNQTFTVEEAVEIDRATDALMAVAQEFAAESASEADRATDAEMAVDIGMAAEEAVEVDRATDAALTVEVVFEVEGASEIDRAEDVDMVAAPVFEVEQAVEVDEASEADMSPAGGFRTEQAAEADRAFDALLAVEPAFDVEPASEVDRAVDVEMAVTAGVDVERVVEVDRAEDAVMAVEPVFVAEQATEVDRAYDVDMESVGEFRNDLAIEIDRAFDVVMGVEQVFVVEPATETDTAAETDMRVEQAFTVEVASEADRAYETEMEAVVGITVEPATEVDRAFEVLFGPEPVFEVEPAVEVDRAYDAQLTGDLPPGTGYPTCEVVESLTVTCTVSAGLDVDAITTMPLTVTSEVE